MAKTLSDTQKFLQKEDPEKTLQTDYIETVVNQRTANARASAGKSLRIAMATLCACCMCSLHDFSLRRGPFNGCGGKDRTDEEETSEPST